MAPLPIHFGALEESLKAAMIFPREPTRGEAFAAWLILRGAIPLQKSGRLNIQKEDANEIFDIACAASDFAYLYNDAQKNAEDGSRAGIVVACLWALICRDASTASWEQALKLGENYFNRHPAKLSASRTQFRDCLIRFAPALHLLGARTLRRHINPTGIDRIIDLAPDHSVNYSRKTDLLFFVAEAKALQEKLRDWNRGRSLEPKKQTEGTRSELQSKLLGNMFGFDEQWNPPPKQPGWPDHGRLKEFSIEPEVAPKRGSAGRPRENPIQKSSDRL